MTAAIYFTPDGYMPTADKLMGRHAAGAGFLRGFVATEAGSAIWGHSPRGNFAKPFTNTLRQLERAGEEQSFLLTTFGGELVKINDNLKKITAGMTDLGVIRRTVLSQDNQIRNLARMMTETIEELGAVQSAALRQQAAIQSVRELLALYQPTVNKEFRTLPRQ